MAKFVINREYVEHPQTVNSDRYYTDGEFIDFVTFDGDEGREITILRIRASLVKTIHMVSE